MLFRQILDPDLAQYAYLVGCQKTGEALVIDPERDVDRYLDAARAEGLRVTAVADTHIHADFLTGARELAERHGARLYVSGEGGEDWRYRWAGGPRTTFLHDGDVFYVGRVRVEALHTPGHTPEHLSFLLTDEGGGADEPMGLFSGDFVFVGDLGRPDLLESAAGQQGAMREGAHELFGSVQRLLRLPDALQVWPGHGAGSACGKALGSVPTSTVGYEKRFNVAIRAAREGEEAFTDEVLSGQPEPPLYFARMKHLNREGPPLLCDLPVPERLAADVFVERAASREVIVLDTRASRDAFMQGHLSGSLYAPLGQQFPIVAGSYLAPEQDLYLVAREVDVERAIRNLVRVGVDRVRGYVTPEDLARYGDAHGLRATPHATFEEVARRFEEEGVAVVDVRKRDEYEEGHVPGAILAPHARLPVFVNAVPDAETVFVHCKSGARAAVAAAFLERAGRNVRYVDDTFERWKTLAPERVTA